MGRAFLEYRSAHRKLTLVERCIRRVAHARLTSVDENRFLGNARITSGHWIWLLHASDGRNRLGLVQPRPRSGDDARLAAAFRHGRNVTAELWVWFDRASGGNSAGIDGNRDARHQPSCPTVRCAGSTRGNTGCSSFTNLSQSAGAPFDGGGLSGGASVSCAPTKGLDVPGPVTLRPSIGRGGIPLGSTELGGAGLSPVAPVAAPPGSPVVSSQPGAARPCQDVSASSSVTAGSSGC